MTATIKLDIDVDGVALITLDVPGQAMNLLSPELIEDLRVVISRVAADEAIKGAVFTSGKQGNFLAGADLKNFIAMFDQGISVQEASAMSASAAQVLRAIELCGKPVAAAINGSALGGGYELCLACHYRVLVDHPKAMVGLPEVQHGLLPGGGGTQRLPRLIGIEKALPLLLSGRPVAPPEALALGLVNEVVAAEDLIAAARRWVLTHHGVQQPWDVKGFRVPGGSGAMAAHALDSFGTGAARVRKATQDNYPAPLAILSCVFEGTQIPIDLGLKVEAKYFGTLLAGVVARNLMRTMYLSKDAADKLARRPAGFPKREVKKLGVLGAGLMGAGIAHVAACAGIQVVLLDVTEELAGKGKAYSAGIHDKAVAKGGTTQEKADAALGRILPTADYARFDGCDLVVEAVYESRQVKAEAMSRLAPVLDGGAILASNTSTLPISGLAQQWRQPEQFIGLHFFSPVDRMPLVEVIVGKQTSEATLARALDLVAQLRKTPIVVNDSPGFYTSRIFCAYIDEGMAMLAEGVLPALIENAARMAGFATGPLAVTDEVSLDLQKKVVDQAVADDLPEKFLRRHAQPVIAQFNQLGRLGRKTGGGFYQFPQGGKKHLWPELAQLYPAAASQPDVEEVQQRLLYIQALESARCVEEGVITAPADADLGAVLGLGFPTWTGGTLSLIDTVGLKPFLAACDRLADRHGERFRPSKWLRARAECGEQFYPAIPA
jgi:3-hydroxyacyl-CoA dehydrogenase/enoyl-CoA hydratase/3-hydroxybutyryl-CoA epimerase